MSGLRREVRDSSLAWVVLTSFSLGQRPNPLRALICNRGEHRNHMEFRDLQTRPHCVQLYHKETSKRQLVVFGWPLE
jgi:hypothetical protein